MATDKKKKKTTPSKKPVKRKPEEPKSAIGIATFVVVLLIIAGGFLIYRYYQKLTASAPTPQPDHPATRFPDTTEVTPGKCLPVYYYDSEAQYFVPVHLPVTDENLPLDQRAKQILDKLLAGPPVNNLISIIPKDTRVNSVKIEGDLAIIDLSKEIMSYGGGGAWEEGIVQSLLLSLTELPGIRRVQILIDGNKVSYLPEGTAISEPLTRDGGPNTREFIPEGKARGYLFYLDKSGDFLVPVYWTWEGDQSDPEARLKALYSNPVPPLSYSLESPAPSGLRIEKCEIKDNTLELVIGHQDFATAFSGRSPLKFLQATILTLYPLQKFTKLDIKVGELNENRSIWSYAAFADLEKIDIPPVCYNEIAASVVPTV